ncbi:hypothetical protein SAMN05443253_10457 [Bacillus sp. OK048]|nr:hypothetical protein SAMN05443253_10457 [Bacillus sp. OK048]
MILLILLPVDLSGRHETPAGLAGQGETPQSRSGEEAHRPPAESEVPRDRKRTPVTAVIIQRSFP